MTGDLLPAWPALDLQGTPLPQELSYGRGVWGKLPGATTDYRWIAASPDFRSLRNDLERALNTGSEDEPRHAFFWRVLGDYAFAAVSYPSRARDAASRGEFLEKQILSWNRPSGLPNALGALLFLPRLSTWNDEIWWQDRSRPEFEARDFVLELAAQEPVPIENLEPTIERSISELLSWLPEGQLQQIYAALLAGKRAIPIQREDCDPLPGEVLAALLLPLPRALSDRLSLAGWLPSQRFKLEHLAERWDVIAGARWAAAEGPPPSALHHDRAAQMVEALKQRAPGILSKPIEPGAPRPGSSADETVQIALWGPSAAGKTALIAQLYLYIGEPQPGIDWEILPDETSLEFIKHMRDQMYRRNHFPAATIVGSTDEIIYNFTNSRTGRRASMAVEDRAGRDFEDLHPEAQKRLQAARGLVILFDPIREPIQLEIEVAQTLEQVHVSRGQGLKDERPIAVCVSKADVLIKNTADYDQALQDGEEFVRDKVDSVLVRTLNRFCSNYRLFPVSSAGLRLSHGVVEPTVFLDEALKPRIGRGGQPLNLMTPFAWVLDEVTRS